MRDVCVYVSVLVCTDFFVFVMSFISLACAEAQFHLRNMGFHWRNTTISFFFLLGEHLKSAAKIHSHNLLQKEAGDLCIAVALVSDQSGLDWIDLFKLFSPYMLKKQMQGLGTLNDRASKCGRSWKWSWPVEGCGAERTRMIRGVWPGIFNILSI